MEDLKNIGSILDSITKLDGQNPGEVGSDGLLHCKVCGEPLETIIDFNGEKLKRAIRCACMRKWDAEARKYELALKRNEMRKHCFRNKQLYEYRFENDNGKAEKLSIVRNYAEKFPEMIKGENPYGLFLSGGVGSGKSYAACCVCNYLIDHDIPCIFTDFTKILSDLQNCEDREAYFRRLRNTPLLGLDDFGAQRGTSYADEIAFRVINDRTEAQKPMIITTNIPLKEFNRVLDSDNMEDIQAKRIYSRIYSCCNLVAYNGPDLRRLAAEENKKRFAESLGL